MRGGPREHQVCTGGALTAGGGHRGHGAQRRPRRVPQATVDGDHQFAGAGLVAVLAQPDPLPRPEVQLPVRYRDGQRRAQEAGLHVRRLKNIPHTSKQ